MFQDTHFIFYIENTSYKSMYEIMLKELKGMECVTILFDTPKNNLIKRILLKDKVQQITNGSVDAFGYEKNNLYYEIEKQCANNAHVVVCFFNGALNYNKYLAGTLIHYKSNWNNLSFVLYYLDIINCAVSKNAYYLQRKNVFDIVYTVDFSDALKYNIIFWPTLYSVDKQFANAVTNHDIYFCGVSKDRCELLLQILQDSIMQGVRIGMDIICYEDADKYQNYKKVINIRTPEQYLRYPEVLKHELSANCILEIVQKGQAALTLRAYEAVVYNKKLLTNNKTILNFKYYDPRYMKYFEKVDDIDWDWVTHEEIVDYGYEGDFSPTYLLQNITQNLQYH